MKSNQPDDLLMISEAAAILGVRVSHIQDMIESGQLRTLLRDGNVYIRSSDLERITIDPPQRDPSPAHKALPWMIAAVTCAIIIGSTLPNVTIGDHDKEAHWLAYLVLTALVTLSHPRLRTALLGITLVFALGSLLEYLQLYIPGRNFGYDDLSANYLGVISGAILGFLLQRHRLQRGPAQPHTP
jgi:VanZ family protein